MLISHAKRFIYTKTVKTGGTSVEVYFEPYCVAPGAYRFEHYRPEYASEWGIVGYRGEARSEAMTWYNHAPASYIKEKIGDRIWGDYFKFCCIRDPFDKVVSAFHFFDLPKERCASLDFQEIRQRFRSWVLSATLPNDRDAFTIGNRICMEYFIRYENLLSGIKYVCERLDVPFSPDRLMHLKGDFNPRRRGFAEYYDPDTASVVARAYEFELNEFGYEPLSL
jgi:sulfotransferase famil protein